MKPSRSRLLELLAAAAVLAAVVSDLVGLSFWSHHPIITSLLADSLVALFTVVAVGEALARRDRRRWGLLAQNVLFALMQSARATWTGVLGLLELAEVDPQDAGDRAEGLRLASDTRLVSDACERMLSDPIRRATLQHMTRHLTDHGGEVIARWAPVMVGAGPYAEVLNRHTELHSRLDWLASSLLHNEPASDRGIHDTHMTRASIAAESQIDDGGLRDLLVAITAVAAQLDEESRELARGIVPSDWWLQRTAGLATRSAS